MIWNARFGVLRAVLTKIKIFLDMTQFRLVNSDRRFGGA